MLPDLTENFADQVDAKLIDAKLSNLNQLCKGKEMEFQSLLGKETPEIRWSNYRGVIEIDGNVDAWGNRWRMISGSVVFRVESPYISSFTALSNVRDLAKCDAGSSPSTLSPSSPPPRPHSWSSFRRITISCCLALSTAFVKGSCTLEMKLSLEQLTAKFKSLHDKNVFRLMAMPKMVRISLSSCHRL